MFYPSSEPRYAISDVIAFLLTIRRITIQYKVTRTDTLFAYIFRVMIARYDWSCIAYCQLTVDVQLHQKSPTSVSHCGRTHQSCVIFLILGNTELNIGLNFKVTLFELNNINENIVFNWFPFWVRLPFLPNLGFHWFPLKCECSAEDVCYMSTDSVVVDVNVIDDKARALEVLRNLVGYRDLE